VPRRPRTEVPGGIHHITTRGAARLPIYLDDHDRVRFLGLVAHIATELEWECLSYCLMENHYHLLLRTPGPTLRAGMKRLNGSYAQGFNARHRLSGHVFGGRYTSIPVEDDGHLRELIRYISLNPVRAGACRHPGDWLWSSYSALVGMTPAPDFLVCDEVRRLFDPVAERGASALRNFIASRL
jgi:REP element-mobilizing transposase RayT